MSKVECSVCAVVSQYLLNLVDVLDNVGNTILGGDPNEKISPRCARARAAGSKAAAVFCSALTWVFSLGRGTPDHCQRALDPETPALGRQIWNWNTNRIEVRPQVEVRPQATVDVVELP